MRGEPVQSAGASTPRSPSPNHHLIALAAVLRCMAQMVNAQQVTQMAKPLPKQSFDKGRVWTVVIGGAVALFVGTVLMENNPAWFPAISRANQAMKEATKRLKASGQPH